MNMDNNLERRIYTADEILRNIEHLGFKPLVTVSGKLAIINEHIIFKDTAGVYLFYNKKEQRYVGRHQLSGGSKVIKYTPQDLVL